MTSKRLYMDVHVIQTMPPSNINRDDTGSPKTAQYGGVRRARVSSQAWKKAVRDYFRQNFKELGMGIRTKDIVSYVADKVVEKDQKMDRDTAMKKAEEAFNNATYNEKKKNESKIIAENHLAKALFFLGDQQAERLAAAILEGKIKKSDKKELQKILTDTPEIDIALFGRMVAAAPEMNTDASCQVAHAISTHAVQPEFDYFTALDDLSREDQASTRYLDSTEYNSSTLYRYANIAIHDFRKQLGDPASTVAACKLFVKAFSNSLPKGMVNSFANQTLPSLIMVTLREDRPVNLVSAFEQPVQAKHGSGYIDSSIGKLMTEYEKTGKFVDAPLANFYLETSDFAIEESLGRGCVNLKNLQQHIGQVIEQCLEEAGD